MAVKYRIPAIGEGKSVAKSIIRAGAHEFIIDEPAERHGTDEGPAPLEYLVGAFIGCTNVIASRIAGEMGITLHNDHIEAEAEVDGAVLTGDDCPLVFPRLKLKVKGRTDASPEQVEELKRQLAIRCPVSALFRQSGTEVVEEWDLEAL